MIVLFITALQTKVSLQNGVFCLCLWRETQGYFVVFEPFNLCGKYKERRFILRTEKSFYSTCLHFAVITHREQLRQAFVNITCKSVPSSSEN